MLAWKRGHMVPPTLPTPGWLWATSYPNFQIQYILNISNPTQKWNVLILLSGKQGYKFCINQNIAEDSTTNHLNQNLNHIEDNSIQNKPETSDSDQEMLKSLVKN